MYLDDLASSIRSHVSRTLLPEGDSDELFRLYAVLLRAKGSSTTESDVHDAWSAWMAIQDADHPSLVVYEDLDQSIREQDKAFATAIRTAASELGLSKPSRRLFEDVLFPSGPPEDSSNQQMIELYKMMVQSSEELVRRRQSVNTFFLTMNGALLTAVGLIIQSSEGHKVAGWGISVLAVAGAVLCVAWRSLITSFGQLNRGKFTVINTIERYLTAAIYEAEWEALERGENPKVYRSFTSREIWVPSGLILLWGVAGVAAGSVAIGLLR
jgi:hypothetical protein